MVVLTRSSCHRSAVNATITIIVVPAEEQDDLERMYIDQRKRDSDEWEEFPLKSGRLLDTFFMKATSADLGVLACADREEKGVPLTTRLLARATVLEILSDLKKLVETQADATAQALQKHGGGKTDLAVISAALKSGTWPTTGDPAVEAAAFARQLLIRAMQAKDVKMAVCWEYRGAVKV